MYLPRNILERKMRRFLEEDIGQGDLTTCLTIPERTNVEAEVIVKESGIIAGIEEVLILCETLNLRAQALASDGINVKSKTIILHISGDARALLSAERTILNFLSRMSGIATLTNRIVGKVRAAGYKTRIACTRKVSPGMMYFDKKAVFLGGGDTHRLHLDDLILIKDNHVKIVGSIKKAIEKTYKNASFSKKIEIEVASPEEALEAAKAGANIIMLDNFSPLKIKKTVTSLIQKGIRNDILLEASGGINERNVVEYAATGIDVISIGEITHSSKALDISLEITRKQS